MDQPDSFQDLMRKGHEAVADTERSAEVEGTSVEQAYYRLSLMLRYATARSLHKIAESLYSLAEIENRRYREE